MECIRKCLCCGKLRLGLLAALVVTLPAIIGCPKSDEPSYYIQRLEKDDTEVQRRAVEELVRMHKKAMPYITGKEPGEHEKTRQAAIDSPNPSVRKGCADFLAKVRRMESVEAAGELIDDEEKDVRLKAIEAVTKLAQVWKKKAVELLRLAFQDEDPECVQLAGEGLRDMEYDGATEVLREMFEARRGIQGIYAARFLYEMEPSPEVARPLLEGLISDDRPVREAAKENVKELQDTIIEELVTFIDTEQATARAQMLLDEARDNLIEELDVILDSKRAANILLALGAIADDPSIEKLNKDLLDGKLESAWRVAAARGMAVAALSPRSTAAQKATTESNLAEVLDDTKQDKRIRIGAAIALCHMREKRAVDYLLDELSRFQEAIQDEGISDARRDDLTQLRIGAQEALTEAGEFVVSFLMAKLEEEEPGDIILWAAAKTLGELRQEEVVPFLGEYLTSGKDPKITMGADGEVSKINMGARLDEEAKDEFAFLFEKAELGAALAPKDMKSWQDLSEDDVDKVVAMLEAFKYPDYVRLTSAIALGQIGGERAVSLLREAQQAEDEFLARLARSRERKDYYKQADVIDALTRRHKDVVFYIGKALRDLGQDA